MTYGVQHQARFRQANIYDNMVFDRAIRPTDLDGAMDFANRLFVFFEMKSSKAPCPYGQRLFLERITDAIWASGKECCTLICEHEHPSTEDIICSNSKVREYRWCGKWRKPGSDITLNNAILALLELPKAKKEPQEIDDYDWNAFYEAEGCPE